MKYKHILFDLDHTLWDYDTNAKETLSDLYHEYQLESHELFDKEEFQSVFFEVNDSLWRDYNQNRIHKGYIRENRFRKIFDQLKLPLLNYPKGIDDKYLHACPQKTHKIPFADEVLSYLQPRYNMHILTNGFNDVQSVKLEKSGLDKYFQKVITSESASSKKPSPDIFEHTMKEIKADISETIMIGDNLNTDIKGAREFGMDQIYFNPVNKEKADATYQVTCLTEIMEILKKD